MISLCLLLIPDEGEKEKYLALYNQYKYRMITIACDVLNDRDLAEDAVQDAFLYLALKINTVDVVNSAKTRNYMDIIIKHKAIDILRKRKSELIASDAELEYLGGFYNHVEQLILEKQEYERALTAIMSLPSRYKICMELHIVYELSAKTIAALTGISYQTVKKRLQRGKEMLRRVM